MSGIAWLNRCTTLEATTELLKCCGSRRWAEAMAGSRPFAGETDLFSHADAIWWRLEAPDWLEAFKAHPRIGARAADPATAGWAGEEQAGARGASATVLGTLAEANHEYERRFGHIFIVCATGLAGEEMLTILEQRLRNEPETELRVAAEEQRRITRLRLGKLLAGRA